MPCRTQNNATHGLSETHQAVEGNRIGREIDTLFSSNTEGVRVESQASNVDVVGDDVTGNLSGAVGDLELLASVYERRRRLRAQECVVTLKM